METTTPLQEWVAIRKAWEELTRLTKEVGDYTKYLSFEQKRELEALREEIRQFERGVKKI